jgi:hypothetical protein
MPAVRTAKTSDGLRRGTQSRATRVSGSRRPSRTAVARNLHALALGNGGSSRRAGPGRRRMPPFLRRGEGDGSRLGDASATAEEQPLTVKHDGPPRKRQPFVDGENPVASRGDVEDETGRRFDDDQGYEPVTVVVRHFRHSFCTEDSIRQGGRSAAVADSELVPQICGTEVRHDQFSSD